MHPTSDHSDLTAEEIFSKVSYWEDPDQSMICRPTEDGQVSGTDNEGCHYSEAPMFKDLIMKLYPECWCDEIGH